MKRFIITTLALSIAIAFAVAMAVNSGNTGDTSSGDQASNTPTDQSTDAATNQDTDRDGADDTSDPPTADDQSSAPPDDNGSSNGQDEPGDEPTDAPVAKTEGKFKVQAVESSGNTTLGSTDEKTTDYKIAATISQYGAGIQSLELSEYYEAVDKVDPLIVQARNVYRVEKVDADGRVVLDAEGEPIMVPKADITPCAARSVTINGQRLPLEVEKWAQSGPGRYTLDIVDGAGQAVLRITRQFELEQGDIGYDLKCLQSFRNLSEGQLDVRFEQVGFVDLRQYDNYRDNRLIALGYHNLDYDPNRNHLYSKFNQPRKSALDKLDDFREEGKGQSTLWPVEDGPTPAELVWVGATNRYFTAVVHRPLPAGAGEGDAAAVPQSLEALFPDLRLDYIGEKVNKKDKRISFLKMRSKTMSLKPGRTERLDIAFFAGPRRKEVFQQPPYRPFEFRDHLIIYSLGGPCSYCTFAWLADLLIGFLRLLHALVGDWGISIMILVVCVRLILHPLTKKSQISMMRTGKLMQSVKPEMDKIQKKYADDPQMLRQEQMKLYREKGISPFGMLGCLPMFLQTPIWIALYAMLTFAIELRHEHAFYGFFQLFNDWAFLRDLSAPDNFVLLPDSAHFTVPLLGAKITSINVLPILMGIVFFINQKLTTPPPATDEAAQQQKIMKFMTLLFPIFLYPAPSGLTLYILTSTMAGIVDSTIVRRHIKREEESGELFKKKKSDKPGGCMGGALGQAIEAKQREMQQMQSASGGRKKVANKSRKKRR